MDTSSATSHLSSPSLSPSPSPLSLILTQVPIELLFHIASFLRNSDIKNLRATCSALKAVVPLRLNRVFLSANPLNIKVFLAIAEHDTFRHGITEIIWDDARLVSDTGYPRHRNTTTTASSSPDWFRQGTMRSLSELNALINAGQNFSRKQLTESSFKASIESYKKLLGEQDEVLTSNGDVEALKYGIQQFPSLERITLTPTTHGVLLNPIYETPMIRSLRSSAVYPLPPGLQYYPRRQFSTISWNESFYRVLEEDRRNKWRGFRVITKVLAETSHNISQFVIKTHHMDTGISSDLLHQPCPELDNLTALIQTPGFRRLDLAVNLGGYGMHQLLEYRARYLHEALAKAVNLEHFSLRGTDSRRKYALCMANKEERENISLWLSLEDIFPVQRWSRLKHFGISKLWITQSDLLSLLASLPETLRSVELSFLAFQTRDDSYRSLLYKMRNGIILDWRKRPEGQRPVVKIAVETHDYCAQGHVIRVDEAANAFLYGSGENPFSDEHPCSVIDGMGVVRSEIDPTYEETYTRPPNYRGYSTF